MKCPYCCVNLADNTIRVEHGENFILIRCQEMPKGITGT